MVHECEEEVKLQFLENYENVVLIQKKSCIRETLNLLTNRITINMNFFQIYLIFFKEIKKNFSRCLKKFHIRETKHLSINADSSTDTTVGWTKNTQKTDFF